MDKKAQYQETLRNIRIRYDNLHSRQLSTLKRCKSVEDIKLEGTYYQLIKDAQEIRGDLSYVVVLFPYASQSKELGSFSCNTTNIFCYFVKINGTWLPEKPSNQTDTGPNRLTLRFVIPWVYRIPSITSFGFLFS